MKKKDVRDRQGRSPIHHAALENDLAVLRRYIDEGGDLNITDRYGFSPLHCAAQEWCYEFADALIKGGANVDAVDKFGKTPLMVAVFNSNGRGELIALLRANGADPYKTNKSGVSALSLAKMIANYDVAQYFVDLNE
jgi:ankyrin repeat protein